MKPLLSILLIILAAAAFSCGKTCYCTSQELGLNYVGFSQAETENIMMLRFRKGSNFQGADTSYLTAQTAVFTRRVDTLSISMPEERMKLRSLYDYILYLPSVNRRDTIRNIYESFDQVEGDASLECNCVNRILSYQLNSDTTLAANPAVPALYIRR
jgi:hypothetical protein